MQIGVTPYNKAQSLTSIEATHHPPIRVLLVTPRYPPYMGGVENHVHQVALRFARLGVDVTVLTTDPSRELPTTERSDGITIRRVRAWPMHSDYYFAPDVYRIIRTGDWDIVHLQSYHTLVAPLTMLAALRANVPYVVTFHGGGHSSRLRNVLRNVQRALLRPLLSRADRLIATAAFEIPFFSKQLHLSSQQFVLIPNGADLPAFTQLPPSHIDHTLIVSIGRLERYKGHHRVLAALPKVLEQRPDVRLWIAGTGPCEQELRRMAQRLGVAHRVDIYAVPTKQREVLASKLSQASVVLLLSEYETHPMAVLEAAALGRPVLVANTSGLSELAEQGVARAIALHSSADQVAQAILEQLNNPFTPARPWLSTWDNCATALLELYQAIIGSRQCVY